MPETDFHLNPAKGTNRDINCPITRYARLFKRLPGPLSDHLQKTPVAHGTTSQSPKATCDFSV